MVSNDWEDQMRPTLVLAAALLVTAGPLAQARPDFSGTWTYDAERSMEAQHAAGKIVEVDAVGSWWRRTRRR